MTQSSITTQPFSSAYLEHLSLLAQETKDRMKGVPPFYVLLLMACIAHITILVPVYFLVLHKDVPITQQIRLTFGNGQLAKRATKEAPKELPITQHIDAVLDRSEQNEEPKLNAVTSRTPARVQPAREKSSPSAPIPAPATSSAQRRDKTQPQTLRGSGNRYAASSVVRRPSGSSSKGTSSRGGVAARGLVRDALSEETQTIVTKYEALLSGWIHSHQKRAQFGISSGTTARVIVRLRINRQGFVQFKVVERSSGYGDFDQAALETVQRASPVPTVPTEYPGGDQVEFLIPMSVTIE